MLYDTIELIIQASSNFHFIFCFCNLIILSVLIASSLSSPVECNLETYNNAVLIRGDDHDQGDHDEHNSVKSEPSFDSQGSIPNEGTLDNHKMTDREAGGDNDEEACFEEQGQPCADSTEVGYKEIQMYAALSPIDGDVKATLEDKKQNQEEEEEEEEGGGGDGDDDDVLRRKIEDFIDKVNKEWRKEKLSTSYSHEEKLVHFG